jgi:4-amino-4-deoxy-L-arabinose transferase-like glycosyltransferase
VTSPRAADADTVSRPPALVEAATPQGAGGVAPPWLRAEIAWIVTLTAFVLAAGAWRLGSASLNNDEAATWAISGHGLSDLLHVFAVSGGDRAAGLYYLVEHLWILVGGTSEFALRLLSVVAAAASIAPFYAVARRLVERRAAVVAAALFATSPFVLAYARDARTYTFATLLVVLAAWTFVRAVDSGRDRDWITYAIMAVLSIYAHWFAALVVLAEFASLLSIRPGRVAWRSVRMSAAIVTVLTTPIALAIIFGDNNGIDWIAPLNIAEIRTVAARFTGSGSTPGQLLFLVVLLAGLTASLGAARRNWLSGDRAVPALVATWFVIPFVATLAISAFKPVLIPRYLAVALPGFVLLLALGLTWISRGRVVALVGGSLIVAIVSAHGYAGVWSQTSNENWRGVAHTVGRNARSADAVVVFPATSEYAFAYYARDDPALRRRFGASWPRVAWNAPFDLSTANRTVLTTADDLRTQTVWLVARNPSDPTVRPGSAGKPILSALERELATVYARTVAIEPYQKGSLFLLRFSHPRVR